MRPGVGSRTDLCAKVDLGDGLVEGGTLELGELEFLLGRLAGSITTGEGTGTPRRTTTDFSEVGLDFKGGLVTERDVDDAVVGESAHGGDASGLLAATDGSSADEETGVLAPERTVLPLATSLVPESLELRGVVAVTGGDTEEEGVVLLEDLRVGEDGVTSLLGRSVHLGENLLRERFLDLVNITGTSGFLDAASLSFGEGTDVTPCGVIDDSNLGSATVRHLVE